MIQINENYLKLQASYLFSDIAKRVTAFQKANPGKDVIKLGIGDVTLPLPPACIEALHKAVDEMADAATFRGYGPEQGYDFLREADRPARLPGARRGHRGRRDLRQRRRQVRHRQHPGDLRHRHHGRDPRSGLPGLRRHQRHGRPHRRSTRRAATQGSSTWTRTAENGFVPDLPTAARGPDLSLLPQQPDRRRPSPSAQLKRLGRLRPAEQGHHPLRRGLRGLHPRPQISALDL